VILESFIFDSMTRGAWNGFRLMIVVLEGLKLLGGTLASVVACVCHKFIGLDKHN